MRAAPVDRASSTDLAFLAMDAGPVPEQFGVLLRLGPASDLGLDRVRALVAARVPAVPRLRHRLQRTPLGCGGPVWVDHAQFNVCRHVREVACRLPGDEQALLDTAMSVLTTPLSRDEPLWTFSLVTGQHRLHTLVTHVRGPAEHLTFGGVRVSWAAAAAVAEGGNSPVYFGVLSYAGTVSVTAIVDPDHFPELDELAAGLAYWLSSIMAVGRQS